MKKGYLGLFFCAFILSLQTSAIELTTCRIGAEDSGSSRKAECGSLLVAENRDNTSRMINLNIAVIRTKSTKKQLDPVLMLAGGPGQSAVDSYASVSHGFNEIWKDRDIILVDQRGTGKSNPLKCDFDEELQKKLLENPDLLYPELEKCAANLGADTRYYTTTESIKDLEEVRKAFNIEKWNLIGISYGTRKALTYLKLYPDSLRTIILDGVVPQQEPLGASHEVNLVSALQKQFAQCAAQPDCKEAFGDIESKMWTLLDKVESEKPTIRLQNYSTGEFDDVQLSKAYLAMAIRMFSYSASSMNLLPLMIEKASNGQLETLASQANMISGTLDKSMTNVELSILCSEDVPFYQESMNQKEQTIFDTEFVSNIKKTCDVWPHLEVSSSFKEPVVSDLPVLLLSGELDPVTPPSFAETTMKSLSNAQHLVAKGQGHNVFPLGCMPTIISDFIDDPEKELDTDCMSDFNYTPFFITMMGPKQ